jgi:hypothetical protein
MPYTVTWDEILFFLFQAAVVIAALQAAEKLQQSGDNLGIQQKTRLGYGWTGTIYFGAS